MAKTNYLETQILNHVLRQVAYTAPVAVYVALFTAMPSEAGGGTEVAGGSYARQPVTFVAPAPDTVSNQAEVLFPTATSNWGTIVGFAIMDAATSGNMLYFAALGIQRTILTNDQIRFPIGSLIVSED